MTPKDFLFLTNTRKDMKFFWNRLIIGFILAISILHTGAIDAKNVIQEIQNKQSLLWVTALIMCIPMYVIYRMKPKSPKFNTLQKKCISLGESITSVTRSAFIMGISTLISCMVTERNPALMMTCLNFLMLLEQASYIQNQWGSFRYDNHGEITLSFVVEGLRKNDSTKK